MNTSRLHRRFVLYAGVVALFAICMSRSPVVTNELAGTTHPSSARTGVDRLADLAEDVSAGRRRARDLRDMALEVIEPSAYAMSAVTGAGLGARGGTSANVAPWYLDIQYSTGQSLSIAGAGSPCLSLTQPYSNVYVCDSTGVYCDGGTGCATTGGQFLWVPLTCGSQCTAAKGIRNNAIAIGGGQYPANVIQDAEMLTIASANTRTALALAAGYARFKVSSSDVGIGGVSFSSLTKGGAANGYGAGLFEVAVNTALTAVSVSAAVVGNPTSLTVTGHPLITGNKVYITGATGMTELNGYWVATVIDANHISVPVASIHAYTGSGKMTSAGVRAAYLTLGETDATFTTTVATYQAFMVSQTANYNSDIPAITGQTETITMISSPQSGATFGSASWNPKTVPLGNSTAQANYNLIGASNIVISGPKYQYHYGVNNGPHLANDGYRDLGEKNGEVADAIVNHGGWLPLSVTHATVAGGTTVTVTHHVPFGCLQKSGTFTVHQSGLLSSVWANGNGFEALDNTGVAITGVTGNGVSPIVLTTSSMGSKITTGQYGCFIGGWTVSYDSGNVAANTCAQLTKNDDTHLALNGTTGTGASSLNGSPTVVVLLPITSATISSCNQVTLVLGNAASTSLMLGYANSADVYSGFPIGSGQAGCASGGACGLYTDQDPFVGPMSGDAQPNWAVPFGGVAVPF